MAFRYSRQRRAEDHGVDDWLMTYADMITLLVSFFILLLAMSVPKKSAFAQARAQLLEQFASPAQSGDADEGTSGQAGERLTRIELPSATLFASGSAVLSAQGKGVLAEVLRGTLQAEGAEDFQITVEGHTDDVPIGTSQFPSNWELSTARAAGVVRFFLEHGIPARRLRAAGYADSIPKLPNRDAAGLPIPDHQAQNRRVVIKLEKLER